MSSPLEFRFLTLILFVIFVMTTSSPGRADGDAPRQGFGRSRFARLHDGEGADEAPVERFFRPAAPWSGRLIMPNADRRRADGGVYVVLDNWDRARLPGDGPFVVALRWPSMPFAERGFDVRFTERVYRFLEGRTPQEAAFPAPWRLEGLDRVSALESLAAHRDVDDVVVSFEPVEIVADGEAPSGRAIIIDREPVQISGSHVALLRFQGAGAGGSLSASPWDPETGGFAERPIEVLVPHDVPRTVNDDPELRLPQSSLDEIWTSPLNGEGWYAYGRFVEGAFLLEALEPRAVMRLAPYRYIWGKEAGRSFIEDEHWSAEDMATHQGRFRSVLLMPEKGDPDRTLEEMDDDDGFLVINLFGWWARNGKAERARALRSGHVSLGFADLVTCPLTGERRLAITYCQVYGLNGEAIIGGTVSWAHYNGNLHRGWMYLRPNTDLLVDFPPLTRSYEAGGRTLSPRRLLEKNLERVMAAYRCGAGAGVAVVSEMNSCAQDSVQGLFLTFESLFTPADEPGSAASSLPGLEAFRSWAEGEGNEADEALRWRRLRLLYGRPDGGGRMNLSDEFFRVPWPLARKGIWREDWIANLEDPESFTFRDARNDVFSVFDAYKSSRNSILPRRTFDTLAKTFVDHEAPMLLLQTVQIGGTIDGLSALGPEKLSWEKLRGLIKSGVGMLFGR